MWVEKIANSMYNNLKLTRRCYIWNGEKLVEMIIIPSIETEMCGTTSQGK
jgi:hypothetical protein